MLCFPQLDLIFIWAKQKWNRNGNATRVQIHLLSFGFGLVETQSRGLYLEEFEPAQILITIDGSWNFRRRLGCNSSELSLGVFLLTKSSKLCRLSLLPGPGIKNCSLSPDRIIGNSVPRYLLEINVTSSSLSMYVNFATRIAAKISLSLLTMTNKAFRSQDISTDWLWWIIYFITLSSVFSVGPIL